MSYADEVRAVLPTGWELVGFDDLLECPCGNEIEMDGTCPEGCVSPLVAQGLL